MGRRGFRGSRCGKREEDNSESDSVRNRRNRWDRRRDSVGSKLDRSCDWCVRDRSCYFRFSKPH
uniref:Uncharacterized protein n=1 Tax=Arabidopsis thaliana TaxID=3702 RepID=Q8GWD3_ARATH|nr:unknown protein [Arabidopsis thaliana]